MESSTADEYSSSAAGVQREVIHPQQLPPGFRFHPTDEELVVHYLRRKAASTPLPVPIIADVDLYKFDPWELPGKASFGEEEWYFFSPRDRKYPNGFRPNRAATSGYWKATGTDKPVLATAGGGSTTLQKVGVKKALVFYRGKPPKGIKTNWIMHEYRLSDSTSSGSGVDVAAATNSSIKANINNNNNKISSLRLDEWVLCRIYQKNSSSSGNLQRLVHNSELQLGRGKEKDIIGDSTDQLGIMYNYVPPPPLPVLLRHHVGAVPRRPATARVVHDHLQPHNYYYKPPDHTATNCGALGLHLDDDADQNSFGGLLGAAGSSVQLQVNHPSLLMAPHHQLAHDDLHSRSSSKPIMPELISMLPAGSVSSVVVNPLKRSSLSSGITSINEAGGAASTPAGKRVQISCSSDDDVSGTVNNDVGEIGHNYHDNNKNCCCGGGGGGGGGNIIVDEGSRRPCPSMMATLLNMHLQQQGGVVLPHHHHSTTAMLSAIEEGALIRQPYDQLHGRGGINWGS